MAAMIDTKALATQIKIAQVEVGGDSKGILSIGARMRLWEAMIDVNQPEASYRCRTYLDMLCVRKVQYIWEQTFRGRSGIDEMLSLAGSLVEYRVDADVAERSAFRFFQSLGNERMQRSTWWSQHVIEIRTTLLTKSWRMTTSYCQIPWTAVMHVRVRSRAA